MQQNPTKVSDPPTQLAKKEETLTSLKTQHRLNEILLGLKKMQDTEYKLEHQDWTERFQLSSHLSWEEYVGVETWESLPSGPEAERLSELNRTSWGSRALCFNDGKNNFEAKAEA